jgi:signal transduction histidine kinase
MRLGKLFHMSLASKCQVLFGVAVISIIVTALLVPWLYMGILVRELNIDIAKQTALTVRSSYRLETQDWPIQSDVEHAWPDMARRLGLAETVPRLIYIGGCERIDRAISSMNPFEAQAVAQLCGSPSVLQAHQIGDDTRGGHITRFALAIRDAGIDDPQSAFLGIVSVELAAEQVWSFANLYKIVMIGAGMVASILAIGVFYLITHYLILSPVRDLKDVSKRIVSGETALRAELATGDEFEELSDAFNEMLAHLGASQEELRKVNASLDARLNELAEANLALFEADRLKGEFLANVSHELRTPLTSIIGFAELLAEAGETAQEVDPQRIRRFSTNILTSGRMLLDLINDLLDLTKIEAGKMDLHVSRFEIQDVVEAVVDYTRPLADRKQLDVRTTVNGPIVTLCSDSGKIQQIVYNLMSNAIKFTPNGGRVDVRIHLDPSGDVLLSVQDSGPGIAEEAKAEIFDKFRQLDGSVTREFGGTGLGLSITRELVSMLGGEITVVSEPGCGAQFIVTFPVVAPEADSPPEDGATTQ